jgi:hypothetical protein
MNKNKPTDLRTTVRRIVNLSDTLRNRATRAATASVTREKRLAHALEVEEAYRAMARGNRLRACYRNMLERQGAR